MENGQERRAQMAVRDIERMEKSAADQAAYAAKRVQDEQRGTLKETGDLSAMGVEAEGEVRSGQTSATKALQDVGGDENKAMDGQLDGIGRLIQGGADLESAVGSEFEDMRSDFANKADEANGKIHGVLAKEKSK